MKFDKLTWAILFGILGLLSLIIMLEINGDSIGGIFSILTVIFTIASLIICFYPKKKRV